MVDIIDSRQVQQIYFYCYYYHHRDNSKIKCGFLTDHRTLDGSNFRPIVSVCAIEAGESQHLNLVAVTQTGVRLYFTTSSITNVTSRPYTLQLMHVRLPPGYAANAPSHRPNRVHMAHYKRGEFFWLMPVLQH